MQYLIKDYGLPQNPEPPEPPVPKLRIVRDDTLEKDPNSLWNALNDAKRTGRKISIYKLEECVMDWS